MRRVILFLIIAAAIVAGAWFLSGVSGHVTATIGTFTVSTSAAFAILALILFVVAIVIIVADHLWHRRDAARRRNLAPPPPG